MKSDDAETPISFGQVIGIFGVLFLLLCLIANDLDIAWRAGGFAFSALLLLLSDIIRVETEVFQEEDNSSIEENFAGPNIGTEEDRNA